MEFSTRALYFSPSVAITAEAPGTPGGARFGCQFLDHLNSFNR